MSADFTRNLGNITVTARGRPRAVTAVLLEEGRKLLAQGLGVREMCDRLGVGVTSWYRAVGGKPEPRARRNKQALPRHVLRTMARLRRNGLTLAAIAERLGLHLNTVHKHLRQRGRP